ncbi:MAG TPA: glycosyltransferase family 1 protein [Patescibacteria group bacterium]|jgi:glycosyltransferase involved in cell wall biosynthesis
MSVRIAVNGLFLGRPHTGMGRYTLGLLKALPAAMKDAEFVVFVPDKPDPSLKLPPGVRAVVVPTKRSLLGRGKAVDEWERNKLGLAASQLKAHLIFQPYPTPPTRNPYQVPVAMAVHDMIPWQLSRYRRSLRSRLKLRGVLDGIRRADRIVTVSRASAGAVTWASKVPADRISVTYEGLEPEYSRRPSAAAIAAARKRYGLQRPFVFYIGGYDFRKNVRGLIEGFAASGLAGGHDLVLAGAVTAPASALYEDFHKLPQLIAQAGIGGRTKVLGFVSEGEKRALLAAADSFAFPSLAEGFGLPVLEALAAKTPVAATDIATNQELFPGAYEPFRPDQTEELAKALRDATLEPDSAKVARGTEAVSRYTWSACAERTARVFSEMVARYHKK